MDEVDLEGRGGWVVRLGDVGGWCGDRATEAEREKLGEVGAKLTVGARMRERCVEIQRARRDGRKGEEVGWRGIGGSKGG